MEKSKDKVKVKVKVRVKLKVFSVVNDVKLMAPFPHGRKKKGQILVCYSDLYGMILCLEELFVIGPPQMQDPCISRALSCEGNETGSSAAAVYTHPKAPSWDSYLDDSDPSRHMFQLIYPCFHSKRVGSNDRLSIMIEM